MKLSIESVGRRVAVPALLLISSLPTSAQGVKWESLGRKDDYVYSWASNLKQRSGDTVSTMMRLKFDREDAAPNNARFDNKQIGIDIRCSQRSYMALGQSYHFGSRQVYQESFAGSDAEYSPVDGTMIDKFIDKACAE